MTDVSTAAAAVTPSTGPILFAYDGSSLSALERAGHELASGRDALVLCVWQPASVGFEPVAGRHFDPNSADEVRVAAQEVADFGASLAENAGFRARGVTTDAAPTWKGINHVAEEHQVSLIVMGARQRLESRRVARRLLGDGRPSGVLNRIFTMFYPDLPRFSFGEIKVVCTV
jgi:nucleotide-binding universal stress UspA family protein